MIIYKSLQKVSALSFDLDDTLYNNMPYIVAAEKALIDYISKKYPIAAKVTNAQWQQYRLDTISELPDIVHDLESLRSTVLKKAFIESKMENDLIPLAVKDCFKFFYMQRSNFTVPAEIHILLKDLSEKVPLAAITNGNVNLKAIDIEKYFSCIIHASRDFPMKPAPAMFEYTSKSLKLKAQNILHVGDDFKNDIAGAIKSGFQAAWFANNRPMVLNKESSKLLPNVQLDNLEELQLLI